MGMASRMWGMIIGVRGVTIGVRGVTINVRGMTIIVTKWPMEWGGMDFKIWGMTIRVMK